MSSLATLLSLTVCLVQSDPSAAELPARRIVLDRPLVDSDPETGLWARGGNWKLNVTPQRATFLPLVKGARESHPLVLAPPQVTIGGRAIPVGARAAARDGDSFAVDRGSFVERWNLAPGGVEQVFEFASLGDGGDAGERGEIVIDLPVATDWRFAGRAADAGGLAFDVAGIATASYGDVVTRDARGREVRTASEFRGDRIRLTVPAAFVAAAALPLVIDPLIEVNTVEAGSAFDVYDPELAYDASTQRWVVVFDTDDAYTNDPDVVGFHLDASGDVVASLPIDITTSKAVNPSIGNVASENSFFVAHQYDSGALGTKKIRGRFISAATMALGGIYTIASGDGCANPQVGGSVHDGVNFCLVAFTEANLIGVPNEIRAYTVFTTGQLGGGFTIADGGTYYFLAVTESDGPGRRWCVAYSDSSGSVVAVRARLIDNPDGLVGSAVTLASSQTGEADVDVAGDGSTFVATWRTGNAGNGFSAVMLRKMKFQSNALALDGATINFSQTDHPLGEDVDFRMRIARDGGRYVYAYDRDLAVSVGTFVPTTTGIQLLEQDVFAPTPIGLSYSGDIATTFSSGGPVGDALVAWTINNGQMDLDTGRYQPVVGTGGVEVAQTGCGGAVEPKIAFSGQLSLVGGTGSVTVTKVAQFGSPQIVIGPPFSWMLCTGCPFGVSPSTIINGSQTTIVNGTSPALVGTQVAIQSVVENVIIGTSCVDLGGTRFQTTDTLIVTLQ